MNTQMENDIVFGGSQGRSQAWMNQVREILKEYSEIHANANSFQRHYIEKSIVVRLARELPPQTRLMQFHPEMCSLYPMSIDQVREAISRMLQAMHGRQASMVTAPPGISTNAQSQGSTGPAGWNSGLTQPMTTDKNVYHQTRTTMMGSQQPHPSLPVPISPNHTTNIVPTDYDIVFGPNGFVGGTSKGAKLVHNILESDKENYLKGTDSEKSILLLAVLNQIKCVIIPGRFLESRLKFNPTAISYRLMTDAETIFSISKTFHYMDKARTSQVQCPTTQTQQESVPTEKNNITRLVSPQPVRTVVPNYSPARSATRLQSQRTTTQAQQESVSVEKNNTARLVSPQPVRTVVPNNVPARLAPRLPQVDDNHGDRNNGAPEQPIGNVPNHQQPLNKSNPPTRQEPPVEDVQSQGKKAPSTKRTGTALPTKSHKKKARRVSSPQDPPDSSAIEIINIEEEHIVVSQSSSDTSADTNSSKAVTASLMQENEKLQKQNEQLKEEMEQMKMNHAMEIGFMEGGSCGEHSEEVSNLKQELERAHRQVVELQGPNSESAKLKQELVKANKELAALRNAKQELIIANEELRNSKKEQRATIEKLRNQVAGKKEQRVTIEKLRNQVAGVVLKCQLQAEDILKELEAES